MKSFQVALDPAPISILGTQRKRPPVRRILLVAGTSAEMWMPIILGLLVAGVVHLLP
jgi:hypothetical protein